MSLFIWPLFSSLYLWHTHTCISLSLIFSVPPILSPVCSVISCKVLQISIGRWGRIIHNMFMRTGVCQSQGQVVHPRVCARVRERFTTPSSLSLSVSSSTPWQHFLGEHTQYKMLEHFHKHTRTTAFVKGDGRSRAMNTGWCRAAQQARVAVTPLGNPPHLSLLLHSSFSFSLSLYSPCTYLLPIPFLP